jgi:hypothetical protein
MGRKRPETRLPRYPSSETRSRRRRQEVDSYCAPLLLTPLLLQIFTAVMMMMMGGVPPARVRVEVVEEQAETVALWVVHSGLRLRKYTYLSEGIFLVGCPSQV